MLDSQEFGAVIQKRRSVAVALWGEAGVGKTYAATQLLTDLPCLTPSLHAAIPLSILVANLPRPKKLTVWARQTLERLQKGEPLDTPAIVAALTANLVGLAPVVLQLEDVHETHDERRRLIYDLAHALLRTKGVGLLLTSRIPLDDPFTLYEFEPLSTEASQGMLDDEFKALVPEQASSWIYGKAAGNPLYTLEYLRFLARQGFLWSDGTTWHWRQPRDDLMPVNVEALIEVQLAKVAADFLPALYLKALLPIEAEDKRWARALNVSAQEFEAIKTTLNEQGILRGSRFVHPLYREVVLKTLPKSQRQTLARVLLETFPDQPVYIAAFIGDAALPADAALKLLKRTAEKAAAAGDEMVAGKLLLYAVRQATGKEKCLLALQAAQALQRYDLQAAGDVAELALDLTETAVAALEIVVRAKGISKDFDLSVYLARLPNATRQQVDSYHFEVLVASLNENHQVVLILWEKHNRSTSRAAPQIASALLAVGRNAEAEELITAQLQNFPAGLEWCELMRTKALLEFHKSHFAEAEKTYAALLPVALLHVSASRYSSMLLNHALALQEAGYFLAASAAMEEVVRHRQELAEPVAYAFAQAVLAKLLIDQGDLARAEALIQEALMVLQVQGALRHRALAEGVLAQLHAIKAAPLSATLVFAHAEAALRLAREVQIDRMTVEMLAEVAVMFCQVGFREQANRYALECLGLLPRAGDDPVYRAKALLALGLSQEITAPGAAKDLVTQAYDLASASSPLLEQHKLGLELDRLNGDRVSAKARMAWFEANGQMSGVAVAIRYFPDLATIPQSSLAPDNLAGLEVLGPMCIRQKNDSAAVRGRKRQELLALLLEARLAGRAEVSRLELTDILYPDEDERSAWQNLKTLVHGLRTALGSAMVHTTSDGYALGAVTTDAEAFLQTADTRLWRGDYLEGVGVEEQGETREALYLSLLEQARLLLGTDSKEAVRVSRLLRNYDPYSLEYLKVSLLALRAEQNYKSLKRLYVEAKAKFAEVGEVLPDNWQALLT